MIIIRKYITVIKSALREVSICVYLRYNRIYVPNNHHNPMHGFRTCCLILRRAAEEYANRSDMKHFSNPNNRKYIDRRSNDITTRKWMTCKNSNTDWITTSQVRWNTKLLFNWNAIFSRSYVENWTTFIYFKNVYFYIAVLRRREKRTAIKHYVGK